MRAPTHTLTNTHMRAPSTHTHAYAPTHLLSRSLSSTFELTHAPAKRSFRSVGGFPLPTENYPDFYGTKLATDFFPGSTKYNIRTKNKQQF